MPRNSSARLARRPGTSTYIRDGRAPIPRLATTSRVMSANRARDTGPERRLRAELWRLGVRGYRAHPSSVLGRPDIAFVRFRIAVFVHGCFWHRCPRCARSAPKTHSEFWNRKFERNAVRDRRVARSLRSQGWRVLVVWEHDIADNPSRTAARILRARQDRVGDTGTRRRRVLPA
jgi:DNA mismatch endonuclease (patch repair protein)